jgi:hypothetical protein
VTCLMHNAVKDSNISPPRDQSIEQSSASSTNKSRGNSSSSAVQGHLDIKGSESTYFGASSWTAVLENVSINCPKELDDV